LANLSGRILVRPSVEPDPLAEVVVQEEIVVESVVDLLDESHPSHVEELQVGTHGGDEESRRRADTVSNKLVDKNA
jgi:hypothetical protein